MQNRVNRIASHYLNKVKQAEHARLVKAYSEEEAIKTATQAHLALYACVDLLKSSKPFGFNQEQVRDFKDKYLKTLTQLKQGKISLADYQRIIVKRKKFIEAALYHFTEELPSQHRVNKQKGTALAKLKDAVADIEGLI
jgi:hypothetical protein